MKRGRGLYVANFQVVTKKGSVNFFSFYVQTREREMAVILRSRRDRNRPRQVVL